MQKPLFNAQFKTGGADIFQKFLYVNLRIKNKEYNAFLKRYAGEPSIPSRERFR